MFKQLKLWMGIVQLNSKNITIQIISYLICIICALVGPLALSLFISSISSANFSLALLWLGIDVAIKILEQLSWHFNYSNFTGLIAPTYLYLQEKLIMTSLNSAKAKNKEEFDYVVANDLYTISAYIDKLIFGISNLLKAIIITVVIFYYSYAIGTIIIAVAILAYFIIAFYAGQRNKTTKLLYNKELSFTKKFDEMQTKKDIIKKYNLENAVIYEEERRLFEYVKSYEKVTKNRSFKDNLLQVYWCVMISVCLAILVYEFRQATLSLALFLTIYNYLLMYSKITQNIFDFRLELLEVGTSLERFNNVVDIAEENKKLVLTKIKDIEIPRFNERVDAKEQSIVIPLNTVAVFKDGAYSELFNNPTKNFKINNIDISQIDFNEVCKFVSYDNEMFDDSIIENFQIINPNLKEISNILKLLGLNYYIDSLSEKEYANIIDNKDIIINFKFNLARAILSNSNIIFLDVAKLNDADLSSVMKTIIIMKNNKIFLIYDKNNRINRKKILIVE